MDSAVQAEGLVLLEDSAVQEAEGAPVEAGVEDASLREEYFAAEAGEAVVAGEAAVAGWDVKP